MAVLRTRSFISPPLLHGKWTLPILRSGRLLVEAANEARTGFRVAMTKPGDAGHSAPRFDTSTDKSGTATERQTMRQPGTTCQLPMVEHPWELDVVDIASRRHKYLRSS